MSDTRHRKPWAVRDCPHCESPIFVEGSPSHEHDWICHSCDHEFSGEVVPESSAFYVAENNRRGIDVYHTDQDCERLTGSKRVAEVPRRNVRRRGLRECKLCSGDADSHDSTDRPCPLCGAAEKGFAQHIHGCDGGRDE